jgi:hypothetical protein
LYHYELRRVWVPTSLYHNPVILVANGLAFLLPIDCGHVAAASHKKDTCGHCTTAPRHIRNLL